MTGWVTAWRIAVREARRARGRTALVLALLLLPVLALSYAAVSYDMVHLTPAEQMDRSLGRFDGQVRWMEGGPIRQSVEGFGLSRAHTPPPAGVSAAKLRSVLPAGSSVVQVVERTITVPTPAGRSTVDAMMLDAADPRYVGMLRITRGRAPSGNAEAALSPQAMRRIGVALGGAFTMPESGRRVTVVGEVEFHGRLRPLMVLATEEGLPGAEVHPATAWLVDTPGPLDLAAVQALNQRGIAVLSRELYVHRPPAGALLGSGDDRTTEVFGFGALIFGLGVGEVVLLAGPAFAVGARRRRRDLALVAANGGTPAHLRRIVLADGLVLGVAAGLVGTAGGIAIAFGTRPLLEEYALHARAGGYRVFPMALAAIAVLSLVTGLLAALVPAFVAARADVVAALAGRRPSTGTRRRWLVAGCAGLALGAGVAVYGVAGVDSAVVLAGLVLAELGLVVCTPALIGLLARLGRVLPLAPRIALRDTARNRASASPAVSAVMAAVVGSIAFGVFAASADEQTARMQAPTMPLGYASLHRGYDYDGRLAPQVPTQRLRAAVSGTLPVARIVEVHDVACGPDDATLSCSPYPVRPPERVCPYTPGEVTGAQERLAAQDPRCNTPMYFVQGDGGPNTVVDDGTALPVLTGATGGDLARATQTLRDGGVVVADASLVRDGRIVVQLTSDRTVTVPGYHLTSGVSPLFVAISPKVVTDAGFTVRVTGVAAATTRMPTVAERDAFNAAVAGLGQHYTGVVAVPPASGDGRITLLILTIAAAVIALGAAGIATGLAAVDARPDLTTLAAVGASPALRRRLALSQAGVIAGLGSLLGVIAGGGAGAAVIAALNRQARFTWPPNPPYPLVVPWPSVLVAALVVPAIAMVAGALLTRSRLPIERRRG